VDITSIKRKKATLDAMANVLNEFLHGVSKGFQDAAFASFSRRRSTVREDINQSFSSASDEKPAAPVASAAGSSYLDMINADEGGAADSPKAIAAPAKKGGGKGGAVDAKAGRRGGSSKPARKSGGGGVALKEV
jgi:hypothetical protein